MLRLHRCQASHSLFLVVFATTTIISCTVQFLYKTPLYNTYLDIRWSCCGPRGAQWLSGEVLDSRSDGLGVQPHWRHSAAQWLSGGVLDLRSEGLGVKPHWRQSGAQWLSGGVLDSRSEGFGVEPHWRHSGAQWLSGGVLDLRSEGFGVEPHWRHCILSLSKTLYHLFNTGSTQVDPSQHD